MIEFCLLKQNKFKIIDFLKQKKNEIRVKLFDTNEEYFREAKFCSKKKHFKGKKMLIYKSGTFFGTEHHENESKQSVLEEGEKN